MLLAGRQPIRRAPKASSAPIAHRAVWFIASDGTESVRIDTVDEFIQWCFGRQNVAVTVMAGPLPTREPRARAA